jgi:hypothetical protein
MRLLRSAAGAVTAAAVIVASAASQAKPTTHGEWVHIRKGADSIRAYVAYPER